MQDINKLRNDTTSSDLDPFAKTEIADYGWEASIEIDVKTSAHTRASCISASTQRLVAVTPAVFPSKWSIKIRQERALCFIPSS